MFSIFYAILAGVALIMAFLLLLQTCEHSRYFRRRGRRAPNSDYTPTVKLFVPCKGLDTGFDHMVQRVLRLDYPRHEVVFIVESEDDPAYERICSLTLGLCTEHVSIIVAGRAGNCGQKVHNLLAATENLGKDVEVLAFMDSDIQPEPDWLRRLINGLRKPNTAAVTGYRWFVQVDRSLAGSVLSALNAPLAFALGRHNWNPIWGGSWAIYRDVFDAAGVRNRWQRALTEDHAAWECVRKIGRHVAYEPACLVASPIKTTWKKMFEFARRQYLITRVYAPKLWLLGVAVECFMGFVFWGGLAGWLLSCFQGTPAWWMLGLVVCFYVLGAARAALRQWIIARRFKDVRNKMFLTAAVDITARPILGLVNLFLLTASALGRNITWRGISYRLSSPYKTHVLTEPPPVVKGWSKAVQQQAPQVGEPTAA